MKYKNVELIKADDSSQEIFCQVEYDNKIDSGNRELELSEMFRGFDHEVVIVGQAEDIYFVKCEDIDFNKSGVELLTHIYCKLLECVKDANIYIGVDTGDKPFTGFDGFDGYYEDYVNYDDFIRNITYSAKNSGCNCSGGSKCHNHSNCKNDNSSVEQQDPKYDILTSAIINSSGGKENIRVVSHCMTRLNMNFHDMSKVNTSDMQSIDGVRGVISCESKFQVIIGLDVGNVAEVIRREIEK